MKNTTSQTLSNSDKAIDNYHVNLRSFNDDLQFDAVLDYQFLRDVLTIHFQIKINF